MRLCWLQWIRNASLSTSCFWTFRIVRKYYHHFCLAKFVCSLVSLYLPHNPQFLRSVASTQYVRFSQRSINVAGPLRMLHEVKSVSFPFNTQNSGNFGWYITWNGPFRFGDWSDLNIRDELWRWSTLTGLIISARRTLLTLSIWHNCRPMYRSFVSCLQEQ